MFDFTGDDYDFGIFFGDEIDFFNDITKSMSRIEKLRLTEDPGEYKFSSQIIKQTFQATVQFIFQLTRKL